MHVGNYHIWYTDLDFYHKTGVGLTVSATAVAVVWYLYLGLASYCLFFFLGGRLVQLCLTTLIWAAPCMVDVCCLMCLTVDLLDSSYLAICCTFTAGYCARSVLPSFIVLTINSLSVMKNQKMSLVRIAAVSGGYSHNGMCTCISLYHSSMLLLPCQKVVNKSNRACTAFDCGLHKSSNLDHMVCNVTSAVGRTHEMYISSPASPDHWITFFI